ncbi:MAG: DUF3592 domain-containing protein [Erythrobacter sp.]|nr:DUF3592 domain-containing protein [Erythrobacter sp.]
MSDSMPVADRGAPRESLRSRVIWSAVIALVVLAAHYPLWSAWRTSQLLASEGVEVMGTVTDMREVPHRRGNSYHLTYRYQFAGQSYEEDEEVEYQNFYGHSIGAPISLTVARAHPSVVSVGTDAQWQFMLVIYAGCYGLLALASLLWVVPWLRGLLRGHGRSRP